MESYDNIASYCSKIHSDTYFLYFTSSWASWRGPAGPKYLCRAHLCSSFMVVFLKNFSGRSALRRGAMDVPCKRGGNPPKCWIFYYKGTQDTTRKFTGTPAGVLREHFMYNFLLPRRRFCQIISKYFTLLSLGLISVPLFAFMASHIFGDTVPWTNKLHI
jgi:hypothetical protein